MNKNVRHAGLIVASNRLPVALACDASGAYRIEPGSGGLITALLPVLRDRGGTWVGWPGISGDVTNIDELLHEAIRRYSSRRR